MKTLLAALAGLALATAPVNAQECETIPAVTAMLEQYDAPFAVLEPEMVQRFVDEVAEPITGIEEIAGVTNVLVFAVGNTLLFGLEIGGCLTDPIVIPGVSMLPARSSGRTLDGQTHA